MTLLMLPLLFLFLIQGCTKAEEKIDFQKVKFQNPMHQEFTEIAKKNNLDLSFTDMVWAQKGQEPYVWGPNNYKINTIFNEKPKSIDILFIGDCTIAWGMIPKVIEQMTGRKVAMYGYASNVLTVKTAELFRKITDYYLKEDGVVVFSFSNWALQKDSYFIGTSQKEYNEIVQWSGKEFRAFAQKDKKHSYEKVFLQYAKPVDDSGIQNNKSAKQNRGIAYLRWDMDTITEYNPAFSLKSVHSEVMPKVLTRYKDLQNNADATSKIFSGDKIFMIPLYSADQHYLTSRTIYYSYYQKLGFKIADMGLFMPKKDAYTMENHRHMANTGGLMMSILIGKWLNRYFADSSIGTGKEIDFSFLDYYKGKLRLLVDHTPENSTIYLHPSWADKGVVSYMKKNHRKVISKLPADHRSFYFLEGTADKGELKGYALQKVYADTLGSFLGKYSDGLIILSLKDDGTYRLSNETKQYFRDLGIRIDDLKFAGSLAAVIDHNKVVTYQMDNTSEVVLDKSILSKYGIEKVLSAGSHVGNKSEIVMNGKNLSPNGRGFNYVIKKRDGSIVSGFVDTYEKDQTGDIILKAVPKK